MRLMSAFSTYLFFMVGACLGVLLDRLPASALCAGMRDNGMEAYANLVCTWREEDSGVLQQEFLLSSLQQFFSSDYAITIQY